MIASVTTGGSVQPDQIDDFVADFRSLLPCIKQNPGFVGILLAADRRTGKVVTVARWNNEAAADTAEPHVQHIQRRFGRFLTEPPTRERFEILLQE